MLNKKAEAMGISPFKIILCSFLIVIFSIILILALNAMKDSNKEKTNFLVASAIGKAKLGPF